MEPDTPSQTVERLQTDVMSGETSRDSVDVAAYLDYSGRSYEPDDPARRIDGKPWSRATRGGNVEVGGHSQLKGFVRTNLIELFAPTVAGSLLLETGICR